MPRINRHNQTHQKVRPTKRKRLPFRQMGYSKQNTYPQAKLKGIKPVGQPQASLNVTTLTVQTHPPQRRLPRSEGYFWRYQSNSDGIENKLTSTQPFWVRNSTLKSMSNPQKASIHTSKISMIRSSFFKKGLCGLKQSVNLWYYDTKLTLNKFGLKCAQSDACLFIGKGIYVIMHVDDFQIFS